MYNLSVCTLGGNNISLFLVNNFFLAGFFFEWCKPYTKILKHHILREKPTSAVMFMK